MTPRALHISTPGRVCLFGEHQDYLSLPVVPCAISLRVGIEGKRHRERTAILDLPDIGKRETFSLEGPLSYGVERDYLRSSVNVLLRKGYTFSHGVECRVHGNIPINSGTSSSSALIVTWINFLTRMSDQEEQVEEKGLAELAHEAEVVEFGEPGGMMDHYSTAYGGVLAIDFYPTIRVERIDVMPGTFVLGDSGEPKDTTTILGRVKGGVLRASRKLVDSRPGFTLQTANHEDINDLKDQVSGTEVELLHGTLRNRDLTREARRLLQQSPLDHRRLGSLLTEHHSVLRDVQGISTPKIERMMDAALKAGAYGGKINGSGGGGCMFVYAPENPHSVAVAIEREGGKAYVVRADEGTRVEL
jgi:galactokinase